MRTTRVPDDKRHAVASRGENPAEANDEGRKLVFDLQPTSDRRADRMGFGRVLRVLLWTTVIVVALFPIPWYWIW